MDQSFEEYERIATKMPTEEVKRRIRNELFYIKKCSPVIYWMKLGRSPRGELEIKKWSDKISIAEIRADILRLVLLKRGEKSDD